MSETAPTKIYVFCNSASPGWFVGCAIGEDGQSPAGHISSNERFLLHDMGITSDWKHDKYAKAYPDGYELVWVPMNEVDTHPGLEAAYQKNQERAEAAKKAEAEVAA